MNTLEETFSPTPLQEASDDTLRSEQRVGKYLPCVLSRMDLLVIEAATTVIWCLSMVILFVGLPFLMRRFWELLAKSRGQLIAPPWVLYLSCIVGGGASLVGIWATLSAS